MDWTGPDTTPASNERIQTMTRNRNFRPARRALALRISEAIRDFDAATDERGNVLSTDLELAYHIAETLAWAGEEDADGGLPCGLCEAVKEEAATFAARGTG
jgi:hypothetical protein